MNSKILGWDKSDCKDFIRYLTKNKEKTFSSCFKVWAKNNNRQPFSVRNYFYKLCAMLKTNKNLALDLELSKQDLNILLNSRHFDEKSSKKLLYKILQTEGQKSVRSACLKLAKNNLDLMLRYQNKYRNIIKKQKELVLSVFDELKQKGINVRNPYASNNVITLKPQSTKLSDDDIKSLFMGLVKLVKENAKQTNIEEKQKLFSQKLKQTMQKEKQKQVQIDLLKNENQKLKQEFKLLEKNYLTAKINNYDNIQKLKDFANSDKMNLLKNYLNELNSSMVEENIKKD